MGPDTMIFIFWMLSFHNSKKTNKQKKDKVLLRAITKQLAHNVEKIRTAHKNTWIWLYVKSEKMPNSKNICISGATYFLKYNERKENKKENIWNGDYFLR